MAHLIGKVSLPKNAYSILDVAKLERVSTEKIVKLMRGTYAALRDASPSSSLTGMQDYYNSTGCKDNVVNRFFTHISFQPFAAAIKIAIEDYSKTKDIEERYHVYFADFYINKKVYEDYKLKGKPFIESPKMLKYGDSPIAKDKKTVTLPNNHIVQHFSSVIKELGYTMPEAVLIALDFFMHEKKEIFGEAAANQVDEKMLKNNFSSYVWGYIDKTVTNKVWKCIQRYRSLTSNVMTFSEFLESALVEKLERLPLEYTDPELAKEIEKLKDLEKSNAEALGKQIERSG